MPTPDQPPAQGAPAAPPDEPPAVVVQPPNPDGIVQVEVPPGSAGGVDVNEDVQKLGALPRVGYKLALMVGGIIAIVTIMALIDWWRAPAGIPANFSNKTPEEMKALVENLKALSDTSVDRSVKLFDEIVTKTLLPVFTSILGYIFGTRGGGSSSPPGSQK